MHVDGLSQMADYAEAQSGAIESTCGCSVRGTLRGRVSSMRVEMCAGREPIQGSPGLRGRLFRGRDKGRQEPGKSHRATLHRTITNLECVYLKVKHKSSVIRG